MSRILKYSWFVGTGLFLFTPELRAQSITVYSFPPPHSINWKSPHSLLVSTAKNYYSKKQGSFSVRPVGHVLIELKKDSASLFTAIVADNFSDFKEDLFRRKEGLAVLFKLVPGHLEESAALAAEVAYRARTGRVAFITYNISDTAYRYLSLYLDSFRLKGYDKRYNGNNCPRTGGGGGCSAFGMSFLELINALTPEDSLNWQVKVNIPAKLLAGDSGKKQVRLRRLLCSFNWGKTNSGCRQLALFDPELMYHWINHAWASASQNGTTKYKQKKIDKAKGLEVDCNNCVPRAAMFKIAAGYDTTTTSISHL